jgi:hypothetical protein
MFASDISVAVALLAICVILLVLVLLVLVRILSRIPRTEEGVARQDILSHEFRDSPLSAGESARGGAFETFLEEDPARRYLPKAEQFKNYRIWRQQNGLNWSNSQL